MLSHLTPHSYNHGPLKLNANVLSGAQGRVQVKGVCALPAATGLVAYALASTATTPGTPPSMHAGLHLRVCCVRYEGLLTAADGAAAVSGTVGSARGT